MARSNVAIIGGGPAGCVAALTLDKLGHDVQVYERETFPRYRIGESLLPGTLSILSRLGMSEAVEAAGFVRKPSATFLWGQDQPPWTFSFAAPRTAPWVFDHAIQVKREEFDALLLDEVKRRGIPVHEATTVTDVDLSDPGRVKLTIRQESGSSAVTGDYVIDAGGSGGPLSRKLAVRRYDPFYRNLALWSYFACPDPFQGDLKGTTYSITFEDGWAWMIPLKGDVYSVGVVVDRSRAAEVRAAGPEAFYRATLARAKGAVRILGDAPMIDQVRVVQDWSYEADHFSAGRYFLCGDAACFTDPLFSQGVHLASQAAVSAAAAIDRMTARPEEAAAVHDWYNQSYREAYGSYHEFLASFYTFASFTEPDSEFWRRRRITESDDARLTRKSWFEKLSAVGGEEAARAVSGFGDRAATMMQVGKHQRAELTDDFDEQELTGARFRWISDLTKRLNRITRFTWTGGKVLLKPYYKVEPSSLRLAEGHILAGDGGVALTQYLMGRAELAVFEELAEEEFGYKTLVKRLAAAGRQEISAQLVTRLMEVGLLTGYDARGEVVVLQNRLHFGGVGAEYEV